MNFLAKQQKSKYNRVLSTRLWIIFIVGFIILLWFLWYNVLDIAWFSSIFSIQFSSAEFLTSNDVYFNPYAPLGKSPPPLPSKRIEISQKQKEESMYGGKGDQQHLGGWTEFDPNGVSNMTWDYMIGILGVKSLLDIGCGRGYSTNYFHSKGARVLCLEGSHDAVLHSLLPSPDLIVEHDFTRGPYWPEETFDACWSVEFLEHVSRQYFKNYINAFRKCALIFITASAWGGYHHVEVHPPYWWLSRFTAAGFIHLPGLTHVVKKVVLDEKDHLREVFNVSSNFDVSIGPIGQHIAMSMMVFSNPYVSFLPAHDHLFSGDGCYNGVNGNVDGGLPCEGEDKLPKRYDTLLRCYKDLQKMSQLRKTVEDMYWTCVKNI